MAKNFFSLWIPVILWSGLIFYLSSLPLKPPRGNIFFDLILPNLVHLTEYAVLFTLTWRASKNLRGSFIFVALYALSDELHQSFVPTRTADLFDLLVDISGMILAYLTIWKLLPRAPKKLLKLAKSWQFL